MPSKIVISKDEWESLGSDSSADSTLKRNHSDITSDGNLEHHDRHTTSTTTKKKAKTQTKKPKKIKDPNKPKHPVSAYLFFATAVRPQLRATGIASSGATLGELWRSLTVDQRRPFETMAAVDNRRYWREMSVYNAGMDGRLHAVTPPPPAFLR